MPEQIVIGVGWAVIACFFVGVAFLAVIAIVVAYAVAREWIKTRSWWK